MTAHPAERGRFPTMLALALVLGVMALTVLWIWLGGSDPTTACEVEGTTGDCYLSVQVDDLRSELLGGAGFALALGALTAGGSGLVQLIVERRR